MRIHLSRRMLVTLIGGMVLPMSKRTVARGGNDYADRAAADAWMQQWMRGLGAASETLYLGRFADPMYFLRKPIGWKPNPGQEALLPVTVPVGFVTDFASIPRVFWSALPPDGTYTYAAILHDYLYWTQQVTRNDADLVLRHAMADFKVPSVTIETIYAGVRAGGGVAWRDNAALKASGERRILKKFPADPTVRWAEWKVVPGAF